MEARGDVDHSERMRMFVFSITQLDVTKIHHTCTIVSGICVIPTRVRESVKKSLQVTYMHSVTSFRAPEILET
jgi:hypothetical protein